VPYRHTNSKGQTYYLHGKEVTLQNGRQQRLFYFAPAPKPGEALAALPAGAQIVEHPRTGLPFLRGTGAAPAGAPAGRTGAPAGPGRPAGMAPPRG
jgi:hypothetical protein